MASSSWTGYGPAAPAQGPASQLQRTGSGERQRKPQSRQLLSCTKCRERKVKCDRTKPCSACCARGHPKECEFVVGEGNDYSPIQQSYEIRKLRAENQKLKERLQQARLTGSADDDEGGSPHQKSSKVARANASRQRRFKTGERGDNLYFGTPGLATVVADFANLQLGTHSLSHTVPKGRDMYATPEDSDSFFPFPTLWRINQSVGNSLADLARELLVPHESMVYEALEMFQRRAQACYFPHTPDEVTQREVERFLADAETNASNHPDMLALIFATIATGTQMGVYDRHGDWIPDAVKQATRTGDVYIAAAMQALRLGSFMNSPTLSCIQTLIMMGPYLTNSGRFLDAFTLFGTTIRLAQSIGLHRDPKLLDPAPPLRESTIRRTLWWWMLHMDQQYSVTLGRPLGISGFGDCPPPETLTTNPTILRLNEFVDHLTILARQILASDGLMNVNRIDEFTDKIVGLWDTMPEALQFNESWCRVETQLPEWPLEAMSAMLFAKVQSFLILLNRQRIERTQSTPADQSPPGHMMPPPRPNPVPIAYGDHLIHPAPVRGRSLVVESSIQLIKAFLFLRYRIPAVLICWTMGQQAFNASMILILDAWETENTQNEWLVNQAYAVFHELDKKGVHKLAGLAIQRVSRGLDMLEQRRQQREEQVAASRRQTGFHSSLQVDAASMSSFPGEAVMGNTGMFLLEDPGLQSYMEPSFQPLGWNMVGSSAHPSNSSNPPTPGIPSPVVPISQVTAAPFPVISASYSSATLYGLPVLSAPALEGGPASTGNYNLDASRAPANFTPINPADRQLQQHQHEQHQLQASQSFSQLRGPRLGGSTSRPHHHHHHQQQQHHGATGAGPRGIQQHHHRLDRPPKSTRRRK